MNKDLFISELNKLNIKVTEKELLLLNDYFNFLKEYNSHTNLTRIIEEENVYLKHFYDSLTIVKSIDLNAIDNLLDIGSGAGFPGIVIKIFFPHLNITLLDSNNKKATFLRKCCDLLNLDNVTVINDRAEKFIINNREKFDLVTSRAVASLVVLSELSIPFVKLGGYFVALKGDLIKEVDSSFAISKLGGEVISNEEFLLPIENSVRNIIKVKKIKSSDNLFPRSYEKILKKPLIK